MAYDPVAHGARCDLCPLAHKRAKNVVVPPEPARGTLKLIIVGEGPGYVEERVGRPFVGPPGLLLTKLLIDSWATTEAGRRGELFDRGKNAWLTNSHLCKADSEKDADLAAACCAPRLLKELRRLDPAVPILALGKPAARSILGVRSILLARGFIWTSKEIERDAWAKAFQAAKKMKGVDVASDLPRRKIGRLKAQILRGRARIAGRTVLPTIHPQFVINLGTWKPLLVVDIARAVRVVAKEKVILRDSGPYVVVSEPKRARRELAKLGQEVACDIETDDVNPLTTRMLCVGVSDGERTVVVHPPRNHEDAWGRKSDSGLAAVLQEFFDGRL